MASQVICLGAINADLLYRVADLSPFLSIWPELHPGGEVALEPGEEYRLQDLLHREGEFLGKHGGGQAANTAWALARFGIPVALVGRVGEDKDGLFLRESLSGVNLDYLVSQGSSGRAYILVDPSGERTILVSPNTNDELREEDLPLQEMAGADFIHLTSFVGDGPLWVQEGVARRFGGGGQGLAAPGSPLKKSDTGPIITLDPGELYARRGLAALAVLLPRLETLFVTDGEWLLLGGSLECHPDWAPPLVLIKRGVQGCRLLMRGYYQDFPAKPVEGVADTLGAGDVFAAGFLAGRCLGLKPAPAVMLAVKAAAFSLAGPGRDHYPDRKFLDDQVARLR